MTIPPNKMEILINLLQVDLEKRTLPDPVRQYLEFTGRAAAEEIEKKGITLDLDRYDDMHLLQMYTAYLYRKRALGDNGMPRMLQYALHCRVLEEHSEVIG